MVKYKEPMIQAEKEDILDYIKSEPDVIDCLKKGNLRDLYDVMKRPYETSIMTQLLYESGIDIFNYLDYVPSYAFWESSIEEIEIPKHIIKIEGNSFSYCDDLKKVTFEDGSKLNSIGAFAFKSCHSLGGQEFKLPDSLKELEGCAFDKTEIKALNIPKGTEINSKVEYPVIRRRR